jgi:hypothetical protein
MVRFLNFTNHPLDEGRYSSTWNSRKPNDRIEPERLCSDPTYCCPLQAMTLCLISSPALYLNLFPVASTFSTLSTSSTSIFRVLLFPPENSATYGSADFGVRLAFATSGKTQC